MNLNNPYQFDGRGRTAEAAPGDDSDPQLVEQVLFTSPGERVNLPSFGSGLLPPQFTPNSLEAVAATQFAVQGAGYAEMAWRPGEGEIGGGVGPGVVADGHGDLLAAGLGRHAGADLRAWRHLVIYRCCTDNRKTRILASAIALNGIDYLEVLDHDSAIALFRQHFLLFHCLKPVPATLTHQQRADQKGVRASRGSRPTWDR